MVFIVSLCACSPKKNKPAKNKKDNTEKKETVTEQIYNITLGDIAIKDNESKFNVSTFTFDERRSLRFLKKPQADILTLQQIFTDTNSHKEADQIILLLFIFPDTEHAKTESKINFNLLENLLKKSQNNVIGFEKNIFGDESMGLVLSNRPYPIFLYCRIGNIFIKLNGGMNRQTDEVINILKTIETKLKTKCGRL